jgi:hypothetical protein
MLSGNRLLHIIDTELFLLNSEIIHIIFVLVFNSFWCYNFLRTNWNIIPFMEKAKNEKVDLNIVWNIFKNI